MAEYLGKEYSDLNDMALHNDDGKDDNNANIKDVEVVEIGTGETLTMLDRLANLKYLSKEERNSLVSMKGKLGRIRVLSKSKAISMIVLC